MANEIFILRTPPAIVPVENPITFVFSSDRLWDWSLISDTCNYGTQDKAQFGIWSIGAFMPVSAPGDSPAVSIKILDYYFTIAFCDSPYYDNYSPFLIEKDLTDTGCEVANKIIDAINSNLLTQDYFYAVPVGEDILDCEGNSITSTCSAAGFSIKIVSKQLGLDLNPQVGLLTIPTLSSPSVWTDGGTPFFVTEECEPKFGKLRENYLLWIQPYGEFQAHNSGQYKKLNLQTIYPQILPGQNYDTQVIGGRFYKIDIQKQLKELLGDDLPVIFDSKTRVCYNSIKKFKIFYGDRYNRISPTNLGGGLLSDKTYSFTSDLLNPSTVYSKAIPYEQEFRVLNSAFDLYKSGLYTEFFDQYESCIANAVYPFLLEPWFDDNNLRRFLNNNGKTIRPGDIDWLYFWTGTDISNALQLKLEVTKYQWDGSIESFVSTIQIDPSGCRAPIDGYTNQLLQIPIQTIWEESDYSQTKKLCLRLRQFELNCECEAYEVLRNIIESEVYFHENIGPGFANAATLAFASLAPGFPLTDYALNKIQFSDCYTYTFINQNDNRVEIRATSIDPTGFSFVAAVGYDSVHDGYNNDLGIGTAVGIQPTIVWSTICPSPPVFCLWVNRPQFTNGISVSTGNCATLLSNVSYQVSEALTYFIYNKPCTTRQTFLFKNPLGQYESYWTDGTLEKKLTTDRTIFTRNFTNFEDTRYENRNNGIENKLVQTKAVDTYNLIYNLPKKDVDIFKDLLISNQVLFIDETITKNGCIIEECVEQTCEFPERYGRSYVKFVIRFYNFQPNDYFGLKAPFNVPCTLPTMSQWLIIDNPTIQDYLDDLKNNILPEPNYYTTSYLGGDGDWRLEVYMLKTQAAQFGYTADEACQLIPRVCVNRPSGGNPVVNYETAPYCCAETNQCRVFDSNWGHLQFDFIAWPDNTLWNWALSTNLPCTPILTVPGSLSIEEKLANVANFIGTNNVINMIAEGTTLHVWYNLTFLEGLIGESPCLVEDLFVTCADPGVMFTMSEFKCTCDTSNAICQYNLVPINLTQDDYDLSTTDEEFIQVEIEFEKGRSINTISS